MKFIRSRMERGYEEHSAKSDHDEGMSGEEKKAEFIIRQLFSRIIQELTQHNGSSELRECLHQEASRCSILDECEAVQDGNV